MTRKLKLLAVAMAALFAMSATSATAASAQNGRITSTGPMTLDATEVAGQVNSTTLFGALFSCPGTVLTGHKYFTTPHELVPSGAETVTWTPDFEQLSCNLVESGVTHKATITMNECDLVLHIGSTTTGIDRYNATLDLVCPVGKAVTIDVYFSSSNENLKVCEVSIGAQTGLTGTTITDNTNGTLGIVGTFGELEAAKSGTCGAGTTKTGKWDWGFLIRGTNSSQASTSLSLSHL